eukprot:g1576.t1
MSPSWCGTNAIHMSAGNGHRDVLAVLVDALPAAALLATDGNGRTALHYAAQEGHPATVRLLVDVMPPECASMRDAAGCTPEDLAARAIAEVEAGAGAAGEGGLPAELVSVLERLQRTHDMLAAVQPP